MFRSSLQTMAPTALCTLFLALAAALGTHFVLKTLYGVPAPAPLAAPVVMASVGVPAWLAGGEASQASEVSVLGLVAQSADGKRGLALLQIGGNERAKVYSVGQSLPNGAVLQAVAARSVTLNAQGQLQTVALDVKAAGGGGAALNPQRGAAVVEALAAPSMPNPMSTAGVQLNAAAMSGQVNAHNARLAAKRLRAAPSQPMQNIQIETPGEPAQQQP